MKDWKITYKHNNSNEIDYVTKLSTGERFFAGDMVWHLEYEKMIGPIRFDESLTGHSYFKDGDWYEGYVRADDGIYPLDKLSVNTLSGSKPNSFLDNRLLLM